jgi:hypothetical protein
MVFGWFRSKADRDRRKLIKKDREHLESRARRFLQNYLKADEDRKAKFYAVIEDAVQGSQAEAGVGQPSTEFEDAQIASATSAAATKLLLQMGSKEAGSGDAFVKDALATVAIAYHRAAGVYTEDKVMQELGTAAVHLLTMATSYINQHPRTAPVAS